MRKMYKKENWKKKMISKYWAFFSNMRKRLPNQMKENVVELFFPISFTCSIVHPSQNPMAYFMQL